MKTTKGFLRAYWCEDAKCELKIKEETKATTRCLEEYSGQETLGKCIYCGNEAVHKWLFAQSY